MCIRYIYFALCIDFYLCWLVKSSRLVAKTSDNLYKLTLGTKLLDAVVARISNVNVTRCIQFYSVREIEFCRATSKSSNTHEQFTIL